MSRLVISLLALAAALAVAVLVRLRIDPSPTPTWPPYPPRDATFEELVG